MSVTTRIKLCGLRTPAEVETAAELGVDFIGAMFAEQSRRRVTVGDARHMAAALGPRPSASPILDCKSIPAGPWFHRCAEAVRLLLERRTPLLVGVFVDQPTSLVNAIAEDVGLDLVQLSGSEPWEQALAIRRPVIKAVHVAAGMPPDALVAECEVGTACLCLLDTAVEGAYGGTGQVFDWQIAGLVAAQMPCFLAGGLTPENVQTAMTLVRPWAVDVSSGIEAQGVKDPARMQAFVQAVRLADQDATAKEQAG